MEKKYCPYPGYYKSENDLKYHDHLLRTIFMLRRNVAMSCYLYYGNRGLMYTDSQYELVVSRLFLLQIKYPRLCKYVKFMSEIFEDNDFLDTGFHIAAYCSEENSIDAESIRRASNRDLQDIQTPFEESNVHKKLTLLRGEICKVKKERKKWLD